MYTPLLYLHIFAGSVSLVLFWIPIVTKKGRLVHRRIGTLYVYTMGVVVISAFILSMMRMAAGSPVAGMALLFLSILTLVPLVSGVQVLRAKQPSLKYRYIRLILAGLLLIVSLVLLVSFQKLNSTLLLVFGLIGITGSFLDIKRFRRPELSTKNWLRTHYEAMLFSGAAAYTAFLAFGSNTLIGDLLTGWLAIVPWILPTALTFALLPLVHRRYRQKSKATG